MNRKTDPVFIRKLNEYVAFDFESMRDEGQFGSGSEREAYIQENPLYTLKGERVKSFGESDIANFLALNGIPYVYEDRYEIDTADQHHGQYHPDFHIKGTNIYIEYFGIDRQGNVARFMIDEDPDSADRYREGIEWKKGIHKTNGTVLIDLYAYDRSEGNLLEELEKKLKADDVPFDPTAPQEIFEKTFGNDSRRLNSLASSLTTAILLIKGFGKPWEEVYPHPKDRLEKSELRRMEAILRPLYDAYQKELSSKGDIDFEDMLNMASDSVKKGLYTHPYRYVMVDEYQDLSRSRYNLLRSLRTSKDYRLFCVGDDWQSIYRFNGCDISYILNFEEYWGPSAICRIERTYRFSGELLKKSSEFISRNGKQYRKNLIGSSSKDSRVFPLFGPNEIEVRRRIADVLMEIPKGKKVLFLGRYNHDVRLLRKDGFSWTPSIGDNSSIVRFSGRPDLDLRFMTIHSSKGLQTDVVFSLNNRTGRYGFPSRRDEPLLISMLLGSDSGQYNEERRLFYVAMTRAKDAAYIVSFTNHQSEFFKELLPWKHGSNNAPMICPLCGGTLVLRKGDHGMFYGCSNFGKRGCRYIRRFEIQPKP